METEPKKTAKKSPKKSKKPFTVREFVQVQHNYTQDERNELTRKLTGAVQNKTEQAEQLKSVSADFKARIKTAEAIINETTNKICNGFEMQQVEARVEMDRKSGIKHLFYHCPGKKEHGKKIREEQMTQQDYEKLPIEADIKPKPDKKKGDQAAAGLGTNVGEAVEDEQMILQAIEVIRVEKSARAALLQKRLRLGYTRAVRIMDELEKRGIVGPAKEGGLERDILNLPDAAPAEGAEKAPETAGEEKTSGQE